MEGKKFDIPRYLTNKLYEDTELFYHHHLEIVEDSEKIYFQDVCIRRYFNSQEDEDEEQ